MAMQFDTPSTATDLKDSERFTVNMSAARGEAMVQHRAPGYHSWRIGCRKRSLQEMAAKDGSAYLPLRERNKQRILQRIVDVACTLFRDPGYEQTTMEMIAAKAEVSRGTLFNYFSTKAALLVPFAGELYEQHVQPDVLAYLERQPATLEALRFLFLKVGERILTLPGIVQALQHELHHPQPAMKKLMSGIGFFDTLEKIVLAGQQRGEIRSDLPAEKIAHYLGVLYVSLLQEISAQGSTAVYPAEVETLLAFLRSGFLP